MTPILIDYLMPPLYYNNYLPPAVVDLSSLSHFKRDIKSVDFTRFLKSISYFVNFCVFHVSLYLFIHFVFMKLCTCICIKSFV